MMSAGVMAWWEGKWCDSFEASMAADTLPTLF